MKNFMMFVIMLGFLFGCSNSPQQSTDSEWPSEKQGQGHYFDGTVENNEIPYLYPQPYGD